MIFFWMVMIFFLPGSCREAFAEFEIESISPKFQRLHFHHAFSSLLSRVSKHQHACSHFWKQNPFSGNAPGYLSWKLLISIEKEVQCHKVCFGFRWEWRCPWAGQALSGKMGESRRLFLCLSCQGIRQNVPCNENRLPACSDWLQNGEGPSAQQERWGAVFCFASEQNW